MTDKYHIPHIFRLNAIRFSAIFCTSVCESVPCRRESIGQQYFVALAHCCVWALNGGLRRFQSGGCERIHRMGPPGLSRLCRPVQSHRIWLRLSSAFQRWQRLLRRFCRHSHPPSSSIDGNDRIANLLNLEKCYYFVRSSVFPLQFRLFAITGRLANVERPSGSLRAERDPSEFLRLKAA